ncbi:MAG: hypothetical protein ACK5OX_05460 [Desertimonas sp.]
MGFLDLRLIPESRLPPDSPDPRTVWSAVGTPMIDPDGHSDAARAMTMHRPLQRVVDRRATVRELIETADETARRALQRDLAIMAALHIEQRRTMPWTGLRPDTIVQLRAFLTQAQLLSCRRDLDLIAATDDRVPLAHALEMLGNAVLINESVPFFIPATIAAALMTSDPPDDTLTSEIRLPFPSILTFFDAIALGDLQLDGGLADAYGQTIEADNAALVGVCLHSGADGHGLHPVADWIISYPGTETHGVTIVSGVWSASAQPGVIANLAALCTWGSWTPPAQSPRQLEGDDGSRQWRRSLERSAVRKAIARGAVVGVHVVDLPALSHASTDTPDASTSRTVRTHWRRGYWNSVRIATRDDDGNIIGDRLGIAGVDWHYEGRWIHPVVVQGHAARDVVTVYSLADRPNPNL